MQEELKALKVREGEAVASARELKLQLQELSDAWQVRARWAERTERPSPRRMEWRVRLLWWSLQRRPAAALRPSSPAEADRRPRTPSPQAHLSRGGRWKESPRKLVLSEVQDELMSVRLREAQALAEGRELRQRVVELETQVGCACAGSAARPLAGPGPLARP